MRFYDHKGLLKLLIAGVFAGALLLNAERLQAWAQPLVTLTFQTSGIQAPRSNCVLPTEHERLVVVFSWRNGKLVHDCMFTGSHGTYSPKPRSSAP